jgi:hypothetical protein
LHCCCCWCARLFFYTCCLQHSDIPTPSLLCRVSQALPSSHPAPAKGAALNARTLPSSWFHGPTMCSTCKPTGTATLVSRHKQQYGCPACPSSCSVCPSSRSVANAPVCPSIQGRVHCPPKQILGSTQPHPASLPCFAVFPPPFCISGAEGAVGTRRAGCSCTRLQDLGQPVGT